MSDFFVGNRSGFSQANHSGCGSFNDVLGASFGRIQQQSFGPNGGSFIQNSGSILLQQEQCRSSVGMEDGAVQMQLYDGQEQNNSKAPFFRSSGEFEMHIDDIRMDRLHIEQTNQENHNEIGIKIENGDDISSIFKPEIKNPLNPNVIEENKNLFSVNQAKIEKTAQKIDVPPKTSPRLSSRSQQKLQRKSPNLLKDQQSDFSSNEQYNTSNDPNMDPVQQKLAKNRESARNSRARKKIYYELLETKVKELQDEVDRLKEQNKSQQKQSEINTKAQEKFQMFLDQQLQLFDKLETCLLKNRDNSEIGMILDALRYRTNSNSQERNDAARAYFDSMVEVCLPIQTKYLIYALEKDKDFFAQQPDGYTEWMIEAFKKTDIKPEQIVKVKKMKVKLQSVRNNISESIQKIKDQLKIIQSEANKVDQMWEQLKECLTPIQLGTCILAMKQNQFRQELQTSSLFLQLRNSQMSEEEDYQQKQDHSPPPESRKLVKRSQG